MKSIKWDKSYSVGVKIVDKQHKHFIGLLNKLYDCLGSNDTTKLSDLINDVTSYAEHHFNTEEEYFEKFHYEDADSHKAIHDDIRSKVKKITDMKVDQRSVGFDLLYLMERWLLLHFKGTDRKYVECFKQHGLD